MFSYTPLAENGARHPALNLKNLLLAGICLNLLLSICLIANPARFWHQLLRSFDKYSQLSLHNYDTYLQSSNLDLLNASAIFNEVQNAVKQKNADLNPVGVSYFPAYIPEGTLLYHSNRNGQVPTGPEWVAMDYEFSYNFAHFNRPNRGHGPPGKGPGKGPGHPHWKGPKGPPKWDNGPSTLLTFEVLRPLDKLLYLGGASAAKSDTGEMDTQVLLSQIDNDEFNEYSGAAAMCKWGNSDGRSLDGVIRLEIGFEIIICDFNDKLRMLKNTTLSDNMTGLVDFPEEKPVKEGEGETVDEKEQSKDKNNDKDHDKAAKLLKRDDDNDPQEDQLDKERSKILDKYASMAGYDHYASGAMVYDGDPRIGLDFSKFFTFINRTQLSPDPYVRRVYNISAELNSTFLHEMDALLKGPAFDPYHSTDWSIVTDRIVQKFAPILMTLNVTLAQHLQNPQEGSQRLENLGQLGQNLTRWTYNLVRRYSDFHYDLQSTAQLHDLLRSWVWDYSHPIQGLKSESDFLIWASITHVQTALVDQIYRVFELARYLARCKYVELDEKALLDAKVQQDVETLYRDLNKFLDTLNWAFFYRCTSVCGYNEICFVPTWGPAPADLSGGELGTHYEGADGVTRISKNLICLSPDLLLSLGGRW